MARKTVLFNDFRLLKPAFQKAGWEAKDELMSTGGRLLTAGDKGRPRELELNPGLRGWHRIVVGLCNPGKLACGINLRVSGDAFGDFLQCSSYEDCVEELAFKSCDLTGRKLFIGHPAGWLTRLDYIKFIPVDKAPSRESRWNVGAMNDFYSYCYERAPRDPSAIAHCVAMHREAGFNIMYWQAAGAQCYYRTSVGTTVSGDVRPRTKYIARLARRCDLLGLASEQSRKAGMAFYPWFRINNEYGGMARTLKGVLSRYWIEHPQFRDVQRDGRKSPWHLSFAFPEVREHKVALSKEMVSFGADGILIDTQRHPPMTQYAAPAVRSFRDIYGEDPFRLPENDPRWLRHKASYFTEFMRQLRHEMAGSSHNLKIALRVSLHPAQCLKEGVDVEAIVAAGLVDVLMPSSHTYFNDFSLTPFRPLLRRATCELHGCINPYLPGAHDPGTKGTPFWGMQKAYYNMGEDGFASQARQFHREGAAGVAFYESEAVISRSPIRAAIQGASRLRPQGGR